MPILSIRIVLNCFYLFISHFNLNLTFTVSLYYTKKTCLTNVANPMAHLSYSSLGEVRHWMDNQPRMSCSIGLYFYFFQCLTKLGSTPCPILAKTKTKRCRLLPSERCIKQTFFSSLLFVFTVLTPEIFTGAPFWLLV